MCFVFGMGTAWVAQLLLNGVCRQIYEYKTVRKSICNIKNSVVCVPAKHIKQDLVNRLILLTNFRVFNILLIYLFLNLYSVVTIPSTLVTNHSIFDC